MGTGPTDAWFQDVRNGMEFVFGDKSIAEHVVSEFGNNMEVVLFLLEVMDFFEFLVDLCVCVCVCVCVII